MDFSYLDKKEYAHIKLLDESNMNPDSDNRSFFIRRYTPSGTKSLHRHKYIQVNYVSSGTGYHTVGSKTIGIEKGDIFIIPPYVPHLIGSYDENPAEIIEFEFSADFILPFSDNEASSYLDFAYLEPFMVAEELMKPRFNLDGESRRKVEDILSEAQEEYNAQKDGYMLIVRALILKLLVITGRAFSGEIKGTDTEKVLNRYKKVVEQSKQYIQENYTENLTLDTIAAAVNYSRSHFSYLFKAVTGKTYIEYLNEVRILKAAQLLRETDMNVVEISFEVGYNSIANFNKNFKLIMGQTPRQWRK